jgi:ankyrin repeat protein
MRKILFLGGLMNLALLPLSAPFAAPDSLVPEFATVYDISAVLPLHKAAQDGDRSAMRRILAAGADINELDKNGLAAIHFAAMWRDHETTTLERLADWGADVNIQNNGGFTALHIATFLGNRAAVKMLLEKEANPNVRAMGGQTPLHLAVELQHTQVVKLLLQAGADPYLKNNDHITAMELAKQVGYAVLPELWLVELNKKPEMVHIPYKY